MRGSFIRALMMPRNGGIVGLGTWLRLGNLDGSNDSGYCIHRYPQFRTRTFLLY